MKRLFFAGAILLASSSTLSAECTVEQIEKMIDSGFSKSEIKKTCTPSAKKEAKQLVSQFKLFINKGSTHNDIWGNTNVNCLEEKGAYSSSITKYRYKELKEYCNRIANVTATSAVGMNASSIKQKQEETILKLIQIAKSNPKLKAYIKSEIKPYQYRMNGTISYKETMGFFFPTN